MSIRAEFTMPGIRYRPTRSHSFDLRGRAWLTRAKPGWEKKALARLENRRQALSGRECCTLAAVQSGAVLMRKHWRAPGTKTTQSEWVAIPRDYRLREVKA